MRGMMKQSLFSPSFSYCQSAGVFGGKIEEAYHKTPSMINPPKETVRELLSTKETMSRMKITVQIVLLRVLSMTNVLGLSLWRARRTISVIVRMRQIANMAIQTEIILIFGQ